MHAPISLVYHGHACVEIRTPDVTLLIDPFFRGPGQVGSAPAELSPDFVLITHGHEDHLADALVYASRPGVETIANFEVGNGLKERGAKEVVGMNIGGVLRRTFGSVRMVAAQHSSTLPDGTPGGLASGFILQLGDWSCYHAGDTGLTMEMELIGRHWKPDLALLPVGDCFTMGPEDAKIAAEMVGCKEVIALHYDTFPPIVLAQDRKEKAMAAFAESGLTLHFLSVGATWSRAL
jgi:L-ascorbate metabolism protein UlaG (beta-lactamase superfamily)